MIGIKVVFRVLLLSFLSTISFSSNAQFNNEKLLLACSHFSNDEDTCKKEVVFLASKNKNNSIISYCYSNYRELNSFANCLKFEYNPLVFLKYKKERNISPFKVINLQKDITNECLNNNKSDGFDCFRENYITLENSKEKSNWIENYCVNNNEKIDDVNKCIFKIKREAKSENNLISSLSHLLEAAASLNDMFETRRNAYFKTIFKECTSTYNRSNVYNCVDKAINPVSKNFLHLDLRSLYCSENPTYEEFKACLKKTE